MEIHGLHQPLTGGRRGANASPVPERGNMVEQPQAIKTPAELLERRKRLGLTQRDVAEGLGLTERTYQRIEGGDSRITLMLSLAMELIAMRLAISEKKPELASPVLRREARQLAELITIQK